MELAVRHPQRIDAIFQLFDGVFMIAALVGEPNHLLRGKVRDLGDVEEVSDVVKKNQLPFLYTQILLKNNHAIGALALHWLVGKLGHALRLKLNVFIASPSHDCLFDILRALARRGFDLIFRFANHGAPPTVVELFRKFYQIPPGVHTKNEVHPLLSPSVEMGGQRKVGVPSQSNPLVCFPHKSDSFIHPPHRILVGHRVARAIHQVEMFLRVGQ